MCPSRQSNGNLTLIFVIRWCNYYKAITICENICPLKAFWEDKLIAYITLNPISFFIRQFNWGDLANFAGSSIIFLFIVAHIIQWFGSICCISSKDLGTALPEVFLLWQTYMMVYFPLPLPPILSKHFCSSKFVVIIIYY